MQSEIINIMGADIQLVYNENDEMFVSVRHVCNAIGIDYSAQYRKVSENEVYSGCVVVTTTHDSSGRNQEMQCLALSMVAHWLSSIPASRVSEAIRPRLVVYQRECAKILYNHFMGRHYQSHLVEGLPQPVQVLPQPSQEMPPALAQFIDRMSAYFPTRTEFNGLNQQFTTKDEFSDLRTEVEELRCMLNVLWNEEETQEVQEAIKATKEHLGWDGRKLIGYIRSELNSQRIYAHDLKDKVLHLCRRMLKPRQ
jgi:hypothetical protein